MLDSLTTVKPVYHGHLTTNAHNVVAGYTPELHLVFQRLMHMYLDEYLRHVGAKN